MDTFLKSSFTSAVQTFCPVTLICCLTAWFRDPRSTMAPLFFPELYLFLVAARILDRLLQKISFRTYPAYFLAELVLIYPVMLLFARLGGWFQFHLENLTVFTVLYAILMALVHAGYYLLSRKNADEINRLL